MADLEKVLHGLVNCPRLPFGLCYGECTNTDCAYYGEDGIKQLHTDALALLQKQIPYDAIDCGPLVEGHPEAFHAYRCGNCKAVIDRHHKYCHQCGREVYWDGQ